MRTFEEIERENALLRALMQDDALQYYGPQTACAQPMLGTILIGNQHWFHPRSKPALHREPAVMKSIAFVLVILAGCGAFSGPDPLLKPQPGYPCGTAGKQCSNGACCGQEDICGGDAPGCPAGQCCFEGLGGSRGEDGGSMHPQRPAPPQ